MTPENHVVPIHDLEEGLHEDLGDEIDRYSQEADKMSELLLEDLTSWSGVLNISVSLVEAIEPYANGRPCIE